MDLLTAQLERWNDMNNDDILVSCTEAARLLGKSAPTISAMVKDGRLHKTTIGISTGIRLSEVLARRYTVARRKNRGLSSSILTLESFSV